MSAAQTTQWLYEMGYSLLGAVTRYSQLTPYALANFPTIPTIGVSDSQNGADFIFGTLALEGALFAAAFFTLLVVILVFLVKKLMNRSKELDDNWKNFDMEIIESDKQQSSGALRALKYSFYFLFSGLTLTACVFALITSIGLNQAIYQTVDEAFHQAMPRLSEPILTHMRTVANSNSELFHYMLDPEVNDFFYQSMLLWRNESNVKILPLLVPQTNDTASVYNQFNLSQPAEQLNQTLNASQQHIDAIRNDRVQLLAISTQGVDDLQSHFDDIFNDTTNSNLQFIKQFDQTIQGVLTFLKSFDTSQNNSAMSQDYFNITKVDQFMIQFNQSITALIPQGENPELPMPYLGKRIAEQLGKPENLGPAIAQNLLGYTTASNDTESLQFSGLLGQNVQFLAGAVQFGFQRCQNAIQSQLDIPSASQNSGIKSLTIFTGLVDMLHSTRKFILPIVFSFVAVVIAATLVGLGCGFPSRTTSLKARNTKNFCMKIVLTLVVLFAIIASLGLSGFITPPSSLTYGVCLNRTVFFPENHNATNQLIASSTNQAPDSWFNNDIPSCAACEKNNLFFGVTNFGKNAQNQLQQDVTVFKALSAAPTDMGTTLSVLQNQQNQLNQLINGNNEQKVNSPDDRFYKTGRDGWATRLNDVKNQLSRNNATLNEDAIILIDNILIAGDIVSNSTNGIYNNLVELQKTLDQMTKPIQNINGTLDKLNSNVQKNYGPIVQSMNQNLVQPTDKRYVAVAPLDSSVQCPTQRSFQNEQNTNFTVLFEESLCGATESSLLKTLSSLIVLVATGVPLAIVASLVQ